MSCIYRSPFPESLAIDLSVSFSHLLILVTFKRQCFGPIPHDFDAHFQKVKQNQLEGKEDGSVQSFYE